MFIVLKKEDLQELLKSMENTNSSAVRINTSNRMVSTVSRPTADNGFFYSRLEKIDTIYGEDLVAPDK
jgi:hypothetical protein